MTGYPRTTENGTPNGTPRIQHPPMPNSGNLSSPQQRRAPSPPPAAPSQAASAMAGAGRAGAMRAGAGPQQAPQRNESPSMGKDLIVTTVTPPFILSFCSLFEKSQFAERWAYRAQINFDKRLVDLRKPAAGQRVSVIDIIQNACVKAWGDNPSRWPRDFNDPILDGDEKKTGEGEIANPGYYYIRATTPNQPGLYDRNLQPITDPDVIYPGCICRAEVYAAAYDKNGNQGVKIYFNKIQKIIDGEPLVVRTRAEDVFLNNEDLDVSGYAGYVGEDPSYYDNGNDAP